VTPVPFDDPFSRREGRVSLFQHVPSRRLLAAGLLALAAACGAPASDADPDAGVVTVEDDAGRSLQLARPATRILSLVPAATETLVALGAADLLVARTDYDGDPRLAHLPSVGGGIDPSLEHLVSLRPEVVIAWAEAGTLRLAPRLEALGIAVFSLSTQDTAGVFRNFERLGVLSGRTAAADSLAASVRAELEEVRRSVEGLPRPTVFHVVATDPPMTAGAETFLGQLLRVAGAEPAFPEYGTDWPQLSLEAIHARDPHVLLLRTGYAGEESGQRLRAQAGWRDLPAVRAGRIATVHADSVSRPGPALGRAAALLRDALAPYRDPAP
jgi:iron complex transport system substrate-binding protein